MIHIELAKERWNRGMNAGIEILRFYSDNLFGRQGFTMRNFGDSMSYTVERAVSIEHKSQLYKLGWIQRDQLWQYVAKDEL